MSQAVSAPITGDLSVAPGKSPNFAGMSPGFTEQESPSRRAVLAGMMLAPAAPALAASVPASPDRSAWDRAYHEYRRLRLRMDAYYALGPMNWANEAFCLAKLNRDEEPEKFDEAADALRNEEGETGRYYKPVDAAAIALVRMPAPDLDAVAFKIKLHDDHLSASDDEKIAWAYIEDDLRRLAA